MWGLAGWTDLDPRAPSSTSAQGKAYGLERGWLLRPVFQAAHEGGPLGERGAGVSATRARWGGG